MSLTSPTKQGEFQQSPESSHGSPAFCIQPLSRSLFRKWSHVEDTSVWA